MINQRQQRIADCLTQFIDRAYYPYYQPTPEDWEVFFDIESHGRAGISADVLDRIKPLLEAKGDYELQIRMVYSECAEWKANAWGWGNPLNAIIHDAQKEPALGPYVDALFKIWDAFKKDSVEAIVSYTGFTQDEKNKYLKAIAYQ